MLNEYANCYSFQGSVLNKLDARFTLILKPGLQSGTATMIIGCQSVGSWHPWYSVAVVQIHDIKFGNKLLKHLLWKWMFCVCHV